MVITRTATKYPERVMNSSKESTLYDVQDFISIAETDRRHYQKYKIESEFGSYDLIRFVEWMLTNIRSPIPK